MVKMPEVTSPIDIVHASRTHVGQRRKVNEDACEVVEADGGWLFVVADGMGGHQAGDKASALAVEAVVEVFRAQRKMEPTGRLVNALREAHERIHAMQGESTGRERMGTTAVSLYVRGVQAHYAWVGDSRIYLVRDGELSQITRDHTVSEELMRHHEELGLEASQTHPDAHKLSRALGMETQSEPECAPDPLSIEPGDMFLLCSDGLYRMVDEEDILAVVLGFDPAQSVERLVDLANEAGGRDNITAQVIQIGSREMAVEAAARGGQIGSLTQELLAVADGADLADSLGISIETRTDQLIPLESGPEEEVATGEPEPESVDEAAGPPAEEPAHEAAYAPPPPVAPVAPPQGTPPPTPVVQDAATPAALATTALTAVKAPDGNADLRRKTTMLMIVVALLGVLVLLLMGAIIVMAVALFVF